MPGILQNTIPRLSSPHECPGDQVPRPRLVTVTRDYLTTNLRRAPQLASHQPHALLSLDWTPGTQPGYSPMVSALLKRQLRTLVGSLFSQSFSSSKYTSTLQCFTNRPCSTTCEQEGWVKAQRSHQAILKAPWLISVKNAEST